MRIEDVNLINSTVWHFNVFQLPRYVSQLEEAQTQHIEQLNNLKMSLKERSRTALDSRSAQETECLPDRDITERADRAENSIEVIAKFCSILGFHAIIAPVSRQYHASITPVSRQYHTSIS